MQHNSLLGPIIRRDYEFVRHLLFWSVSPQFRSISVFAPQLFYLFAQKRNHTQIHRTNKPPQTILSSARKIMHRQSVTGALSRKILFYYFRLILFPRIVYCFSASTLLLDACFCRIISRIPHSSTKGKKRKPTQTHHLQKNEEKIIKSNKQEAEHERESNRN